MKFLARLILAFIANAVAVFAASYFIDKFQINYSDIIRFAIVVGILTIFNLYLKPIVKMVLSPLIIISFGLFNIIINAVILKVVDMLSQNLTISGFLPLLYASLIISGVNLIIHFSAKIFYKTASKL